MRIHYSDADIANFSRLLIKHSHLKENQLNAYCIAKYGDVESAIKSLYPQLLEVEAYIAALPDNGSAAGIEQLQVCLLNHI